MRPGDRSQLPGVLQRADDLAPWPRLRKRQAESYVSPRHYTHRAEGRRAVVRDLR